MQPWSWRFALPAKVLARSAHFCWVFFVRTGAAGLIAGKFCLSLRFWFAAWLQAGWVSSAFRVGQVGVFVSPAVVVVSFRVLRVFHNLPAWFQAPLPSVVLAVACFRYNSMANTACTGQKRGGSPLLRGFTPLAFLAFWQFPAKSRFCR
jgi:hypothetical protein